MNIVSDADEIVPVGCCAVDADGNECCDEYCEDERQAPGLGWRAFRDAIGLAWYCPLHRNNPGRPVRPVKMEVVR